MDYHKSTGDSTAEADLGSLHIAKFLLYSSFSPVTLLTI
ncbi:hypothetical protein SITYG_04930 [Streptococcus intermedius]|uniref:Uncharacterized protein n=1 Tax=Streptococcus intermedius TaxID=1338 RepID=A0AAD1C793_STRIT|nr:hypothetical protein SITYG_04930 [Streptococcus intermedius]